MAEATTAVSTEARATHEVQVTLDLLDELFAGFGNPGFAVRLWEGTHWGPRPEQARTILVLRQPGSLRRFLSRPTHRHLAECYLHDVVDVDGEEASADDRQDQAGTRPTERVSVAAES